MALDQLLEQLEAHGWLGGAHAGPALDPKGVRRHRRLRVAAPRVDDAGGGDPAAVHPHPKLVGHGPQGPRLARRPAGRWTEIAGLVGRRGAAVTGTVPVGRVPSLHVEGTLHMFG